MAELSFEQAMKRIEEIVADLEKGDLPLEKSLDAFEEAVMLARKCQGKLKAAQDRIAKLVKTDDGEVILEPFGEAQEE
jgi:exodeoxyribonuclease VII small subunit